ncbi:peptidyl-prolyl cis-trans isomerase [Bacillus mangrovi]|uniref:Peptidyl-prolyl cis-trans isomerase n=1 Tax=Metabacillus mangrovi TaxID=1491830 RepID=A0A7X2V3E4_9BACI|nr:peptidyl-prolyl cis-trans isomerase [Metabacillus mangrovi]MTH52587.1 peptidyl-prolyl cis-trans isomerase [Metabacillus mangrovi]
MSIIQITGKVKYPITLDPGVWIFDDRKADLESFFHDSGTKADETENYTKQISAHWDREIKEGNEAPSIQKKQSFKKQELVSGTFGIRLSPFLQHAEAEQDATSVHILTDGEMIALPLKKAHELIAAFSKEGKPLKEDGPMHLYYGDGSNKDRPITAVKEIMFL